MPFRQGCSMANPVSDSPAILPVSCSCPSIHGKGPVQGQAKAPPSSLSMGRLGLGPVWKYVQLTGATSSSRIMTRMHQRLGNRRMLQASRTETCTTKRQPLE